MTPFHIEVTKILGTNEGEELKFFLETVRIQDIVKARGFSHKRMAGIKLTLVTIDEGGKRRDLLIKEDIERFSKRINPVPVEPELGHNSQ